MIDFLTFHTFISAYVLIALYTFSAFVLPFVIWYMLKRLSIKFKLFQLNCDNIKSISWSLLNHKQRMGLVAAYICILLGVEIIWRMMFEFLIAYMQIRDALVL